MAPDTGDVRLFLSLRSDGAAAPVLLQDARDPGRLFEIASLERPGAELRGAWILVDGPGSELAERDGCLLAPRGLVWSLLDPLAAGQGNRLLLQDPLAGQQALRREGSRLWAGLARWRELPVEVKRDVRRLLAPLPHAGGLLDLCDALAAGGAADPFDGQVAPPAAQQRSDGSPVPAPTIPLPDDPEELAAWLEDPDGFGVLYGPSFTPRAAQGVMARDVAEALRTANPLLVEAGTGVGKTLAYLAPLLAHLRRTGGRGVVSTQTRTLQSQLLEQDLPLLAGAVPEVEHRLLMGRSNYLCRTGELRFLERPAVTPAESWAQASLRLWLAATTDGLREEVQDHPVLRRYVPEIFDTPEPCSPSVCYGPRECHVQRARRLAREARLVIVNHALLMVDFAAGHTLVGEYDTVVVDEAHRLPQAALDAFEVRCDASRSVIVEDLLGEPARVAGGFPAVPRRLIADLALGGEAGEAAAARLADFVHALLGALAAYRTWFAALEAHFVERRGQQRLHGKVRVHDRGETFGPVTHQTTAYLDAAAAVDHAYAEFAAGLEDTPSLGEDRADELGTLARAAEMSARLQQDVAFLTTEDDPDWVVWLEPGREQGLVAAGATRLESGPLLGDLWRRSDLAPILTSATLGVGEDFSYMERELGVGRLGRGAVTSLIPSPFDYREQARFMTTPGFPVPDTPPWQAAVAELVERLVRVAPRKTMVLFTSYAALQGVAGRLREALDRSGPTSWPAPRPVLLVQGSGAGAGELMTRFRQERHSLLLGTSTFWEGVDLPGADLEILVVTKLPFAVPTDPWVEAKCERIAANGDNAFIDFVVRDAVLRLRQGVGRLIRSRRDRGVVVLLDSRLHGKPYGMTFLKALPSAVTYCADADEIVRQTGAFFDAAWPVPASDGPDFAAQE
jgi:DNA polymerase-3 subunit epsilon/ATP-dependent DNA helicase DinG